jgi:hypothetical protein
MCLLEINGTIPVVGNRCCQLRQEQTERDSVKTRSRGSSVSVVTRLRTGRPGFDSRQEQNRNFSSSLHSDQLWEAPSFLSNGYWALFPPELKPQGVKLSTHFNPLPGLRIRGGIQKLDASSEAFMAVMFQVQVFWLVTPCSVMGY